MLCGDHTFKYGMLPRAAQAATSEETDTLYGCFALHRKSIMPKGKLPYPTRIPARAALLLKVLSTTRLSNSWTHLIRDGSSANSIYASSSTTSTGSCRMAMSSCSCMRLPSGLFGEVRNTIFGLCCLTAAVIPASEVWAVRKHYMHCLNSSVEHKQKGFIRRFWLPCTSMLKSSFLKTVITLASFTAASNLYMVKVGGQSIMLSPGSSTQRISKSISSSAPQPTCTSASTLAYDRTWQVK